MDSNSNKYVELLDTSYSENFKASSEAWTISKNEIEDDHLMERMAISCSVTSTNLTDKFDE